MPRGRPVGWKKPDANSQSIMVRVSAATRVWLVAQSQASGLTESEIIRQLLEQRMAERTATTSKEQEQMRGSAQVGHDAVVVWSPSHQTHVNDLRAQLARGCHERPRGSFQKSPTGMYYSWLDAPTGKCEICGRRCQYR